MAGDEENQKLLDKKNDEGAKEEKGAADKLNPFGGDDDNEYESLDRKENIS